MTLLFIGWASLTLVFGLPTIKNLFTKCLGTITKQGYRQSTMGVIIDRISLANLMTFIVYMIYFN